jgi:hypothetical protein
MEPYLPLSEGLTTLEAARLLAARLERLSADSRWAHKASGLRGSLLRAIEALEQGSAPEEAVLEDLVRRGFEILENAAREIRPPEER